VGSMSRQQGRGGMGRHKHGDHAGPSPKSRMWPKLLAKREEALRRRRFRHREFFGSVKEFASQVRRANDGLIRQASSKGMREDKSAKSVIIETAASPPTL
jgi:hypothetical protein